MGSPRLVGIMRDDTSLSAEFIGRVQNSQHNLLCTMSNPPCTDHNPNSQSSTTSRSPPKYPRPWNKKLRSEFDDVPSNATDESLWYGPWDTALHRLFKDHDGFQIAPQHLKSGHCGEPEWSVWYLIKSGAIPVCIVEVKPYFHLKRPKKRIDAYTQVADRLQELITDDPAITKLYGVSVIGVWEPLTRGLMYLYLPEYVPHL